jgi:hypothetical protein
MNLPPLAVKDHNFSLFKEEGVGYIISVFKCSKCNYYCFVPPCDYWDWMKLTYASNYESQGFYYFLPYCSWELVDSLNNLSCQELIIKDIIQ